MKVYFLTLLALALAVKGVTAAASGSGYNLVANPHFDSDLTGWTTSSATDVSWSSSFDHHDEGSAGVGSVLVSAPTTSEFLTQCITVDHDLRYFATVWAFSQCGHAAELSLFWADGECSIGVGELSATTTAASWQKLLVAGVAPPGHDVSAVLVLHNTGECHDDAHFDDVFLTEDTIFQDSFEPKF